MNQHQDLDRYREMLSALLREKTEQIPYMFLPEERAGNPDFKKLPRMLIDELDRNGDMSLFQVTYHGDGAGITLRTLSEALENNLEALLKVMNVGEIEIFDIMENVADGVVFKFDTACLNFMVWK